MSQTVDPPRAKDLARFGRPSSRSRCPSSSPKCRTGGARSLRRRCSRACTRASCAASGRQTWISLKGPLLSGSYARDTTKGGHADMMRAERPTAVRADMQSGVLEQPQRQNPWKGLAAVTSALLETVPYRERLKRPNRGRFERAMESRASCRRSARFSKREVGVGPQCCAQGTRHAAPLCWRRRQSVANSRAELHARPRTARAAADSPSAGVNL